MEIKLHRQINEEVPRGKGTEKVENSIKEKGCRRSYGSTFFPIKMQKNIFFHWNALLQGMADESLKKMSHLWGG